MRLRLLAFVVATLAACDDPSRVLLGQLYVENRDCLGTPSSVDVVSGDERPGPCAPTCLVQRSYDAARPVYVTTSCGPFPGDADVSGSDPRCALALDALARRNTCFTDGGAAHPRATDAGPDGG